ncbi:hypothetical protein D9758_016780 [Tetrapyrgos nigripes]|uniref:Mitochondrial group I intron splicing factor CCM1 n=1 Tax=Tetrapyrgos nigripes TaxID=182062 RepID=A0A8H5F8Z9_9AGAR|nr:hypothetical protein D9758_016780 [Tetrapyrgos nigripes]
MLPPTLIDLTLARLSSPRHLVNPQLCLRLGNVRHIAQAALAFKEPETPPSHPPVTYPAYNPGSSSHQVARKRPPVETALKVRSGRKPAKNGVSELGQRVQALEKVAEIEESEFSPLAFSEMDLAGFYEELLEHPSTAQVEENNEASHREMALLDVEAQLREDLSVVDELHNRLQTSQRTTSRSGVLSESLRRHAGITSLAEPLQTEAILDTSMPTYRRVLKEIQTIFTQLESFQSQIEIPIGLLSYDEWETMYRVCIRARDGEAVETTLDLMKRSKVEVTEDLINGLLEMYGEAGNTTGVEQCLSRFLESAPNERQRHLHIKAHLNACPPTTGTIPESALSVLHNYEEQSLLPAQKSYSQVITHLFSIPSSASQAQAWDLFTHMRYVAHPNPDPILYTSMIRACASPYHTARSSEPERALDLWYEMTTERNMLPTTGTYNAVILACARSGLKRYVSEAFRIAKEMMDSHRDAYGRPAYVPDRKTFIALLEGAKRIGDLTRTRWILVEMVTGRSKDVGVDEEVMMNVFHAYTVYKPPFRRGLAKIVGEDEAEGTEELAEIPKANEAQQDQPQDVTVQNTATFTHIPPQSSHEVLLEADILFHRILHDTGRTPVSDLDAVFPSEARFNNVQITTRLVNSYMSVHYKHSSLESAKNLFGKVFEEAGVEKDARTYLEAMQICSMAPKREREVALQFADELYREWTKMENDSRNKISARTVEKVHAAYIKILTLTNNLDRAMSQLRLFVSCYPPSDLRDPEAYSKSSFQTTRTRLVGAHPLVRLSTPIDIPDDSVPPLMTFRDLGVVHHRLVVKGDRPKDVAYITYVCKAYEWALRVRRDERMRAKPPKLEKKVTEMGILAEEL